jgi:hypothetical protein
MKLLTEFKEQVAQLGKLRRVWITSFNLSVDFVETHLLPVVVEMDAPKNRMDYETFQKELIDKKIDFRVFCDKRMINQLDTKRTTINVFSVSPRILNHFSEDSLFHPKVMYLEDYDGRAILGAGSANLTMSGWGRNQEVFAFRKVSTKEQSVQAREFFRKLVDDKQFNFGTNFWGQDKKWKFVHSFQKEAFLNQLLSTEDKELAVWSPYFPRDIPAFIANIKDITDLESLKVHITPDRIEGRVIRTQWSDKLKELVDNGELNFYNNSIRKHQNTELCHAKIWKTKSKLAIGSWNFTGPGSNGLMDSDSNWSTSNNIEAGFIFYDGSEITMSLGLGFDVSQEDFASKELLDEESLDVQKELPFDIQVKFDWNLQQYSFIGEWIYSDNKTEYQIKLPDLEKINMASKRASSSLGMPAILIDSPKEILTQHTFDIVVNDNIIYRGLILETNVLDRRVQAYDSLNDLLDSLITQIGFDSLNCTTTREELKVDGELFDEEVEIRDVSTEPTASYFRLFQATSNFEKYLKSVKNVDQLNKLVFVHPGCLFEMCEKIKYEIAHSEPEVFIWFLVEEFNLLVKLARDQYENLRPKGSSTIPPENKWNPLVLKSPPLPKELRNVKRYLKIIKKECNYA